jgi:plasmid stabilization system protein ParE
MAQVTLLWSDRAITDLEQIADFIALDSPAGATSFVTKVVEAVFTLQAFPEAGRVVPEYGESSLRELIFRNYRIVYRKDEQSVAIVTVFHGSRSL